MSPKGVEHGSSQWGQDLDRLVHSSMSPKGVEHPRQFRTVDGLRRAFINVAERR